MSGPEHTLTQTQVPKQKKTQGALLQQGREGCFWQHPRPRGLVNAAVANLKIPRTEDTQRCGDGVRATRLQQRALEGSPAARSRAAPSEVPFRIVSIWFPQKRLHTKVRDSNVSCLSFVAFLVPK